MLGRSLCGIPLLIVSLFAAGQELPFTQFTPSDQVSPLPSASVQKILQDYKSLQDIIAILGMDELSEEDKLTVSVQ